MYKTYVIHGSEEVFGSRSQKAESEMSISTDVAL